MNHPNLQELAQRIHEMNKAAGWWDIPRPRVQTAWLVITELAEATEAERAGKYADLEAFETELSDNEKVLGIADSNETALLAEHRVRLWAATFKRHIKDTFEDEIADAVIRLLDFAGSEGVKMTVPYTDVRKISNEQAFFYVSNYAYTIVSVLERRSDGGVEREFHCALYVLARIAGLRGFDLWKHVDLKLKYNATRPKMHGGKKF